MLTRLEDAQRVFALAKHLLEEHKVLARIHARKTASHAAGVRQSNDATFQAIAVARAESALHAACVDAGLADLRSPEYYEPRVVRPSGFHDHRFVPAKPAALSTLESATPVSDTGGAK